MVYFKLCEVLNFGGGRSRSQNTENCVGGKTNGNIVNRVMPVMGCEDNFEQ